MPRNQSVYGKRRKGGNNFVTSERFSWSPAKVQTPPETSQRTKDDPIDILSDNLKNVSLQKPQDLKKDTKTNHRVLKTKDGNTVKKRAAAPKGEKILDATRPSEKPLLLVKDLKKEDTSQSNSADLDEPRKNQQRTESQQEQGPTNSAKITEDSENLCSEPNSNKKTTSTKARSVKASRTKGRHAPLAQPQEESPSSETIVEHVPPANPAVNSVSLSNCPLVVHSAPLLQFCIDPEGRLAPTPFSDWSFSLEHHFNITKIAEASYGEVYRLSLKSHVQGFTKSDESVLKIIALKPPAPAPGRNGKIDKRHSTKTAMMSAVENVVSEIRLLQRMTSTPGFTNFRDVRVLRGRPSKMFADAWKAFNKTRPKGDKSIFPDPGRKTSYDDDQLWAVIEMQDAGSDLERVAVNDVWGVWDVFWGVALAIAKGEEDAKFEHRDLHLGNICVKLAATNASAAEYSVKNTAAKLGFTGLETTIIDYTLSRAEMETNPDGSSLDEEQVAFLDLEADPELFDGDGEEEYQYDIYRFMRAAMYLSDPLADLSVRWDEAIQSGRTWRGFHPQTNVVWLHFVLVKLLGSMHWPSKDPTLAVNRLVNPGDKNEALERAIWLEKALLALKALFELGNFQISGLTSTRDLVGLALTNGWLNESDIIGATSTEPIAE